jgi:16S rRNA (adenine1518-N6/adenine1519-N6)-dimethyltransferase
MSILSVSVQFYGKPAIAGRVPARSFYPAPKVDSVILSIDVYDRPPVTVPGAEAFFRVVRAGFSAPRKQLRNSLAQGLGISAEESAAALARAGVDPRRRAETLDLQEWARLCQERAGNG